MDEKTNKNEEVKKLESDAIEVLTKEAEKGLFTFYREQVEYEEKFEEMNKIK
jgi:hypothetical protein